MIDKAVTEILTHVTDNVFEREVASTALLPALCYVPITDTPNDTLDATGYRVARYQISAVSIQSADAATLAKQVRQHLKFVKGSFGGVNIALIKEQNTIPDFSGHPNVHRKMIDFNFYYGE